MPADRPTRAAARYAAAAIATLVYAFALGAADAETIKIGVSKLATCGPLAIARDKGYFAAEGLTPDFAFFDAQQPIAVAVASGDLDFGIAAPTAALYSLAGSGTLRVIGGGVSEAPTFHYLGFIASNKAYDAGLKAVRDFAGHSVALTQVGTGLQYSLGLAADKYGFDYKSVIFLALQSNANIASALAGGRADAAVFSSTGALPLVERGDAKLLGWVGDETGGFQANFTFSSAKTADERRDTVERFLRAFRKGARDYHDAFADRDGKRKDGPTSPEMLAIIAKYLDQPEAIVERGLPYIDADIRIDVADVQHQLEWYRAQGLMKTEVKAEALLDPRYVIPLPPR